MLMDSRLIVSRLQREGWELIRTRGSHHVFRRPGCADLVVVPHPRKDFPVGTARNIHRAAGRPVA
ncbi:type II toxin-antitoxin system HicA family toxin [Lichenibacterium minor]|uniref:Type II toxin-antitoxin system HicA family toxin n=1 Tax=Lichenibacterium minor TaxID=2316528 RepID=A0A4V1RUS8_9HYPH|nr:type II toxin-antitoxin system HicA family toxin [Lichenibacterium minor]RYC32204.1 type II toxin-antitoxin system HicA family toxin [Lichenibacterium minor]